MKPTNQQILLVDGHGLLFRAFYAMSHNLMLKTKGGVPTNAVYGFVRMLNKYINKNEYFDIIVAFDKGKQTFRHKMYPIYKAQRKATPSELKEQIPIIKEYLTASGIKHIEHDNYEADDLIATLAKLASKGGYKVAILTADQDLMQLINTDTTLLMPVRGASKLSIYGVEEFKNKYGFEPKQIIDWKAIAGDPSDNIKGVPGIGGKGATKLVSTYGSVEAILQHLEELPTRQQDQISASKSDLIMFKKLTTLRCDVAPLSVLPFSQYQITLSGQQDFFQKYDFKSLQDATVKSKTIIPTYTVINR